MIDVPRPLFLLGRVVGTPGAVEALQEIGTDPSELLDRHVTGDFGDIPEEDLGLNEAAIQDGSRIFSVYKLRGDLTIWIITEADRSSTCLMLPEEY